MKKQKPSEKPRGDLHAGQYREIPLPLGANAPIVKGKVIGWFDDPVEHYAAASATLHSLTFKEKTQVTAALADAAKDIRVLISAFNESAEDALNAESLVSRQMHVSHAQIQLGLLDDKLGDFGWLALNKAKEIKDANEENKTTREATSRNA